MNKEEEKEVIKKIKHIYKGIDSYSLDDKDPYNNINKFKNKNDVVATYGEILPAGVCKIINNISIDENDVFFDLGCGCGKVVTQFYYQTCVKSSNGVEFSTTRFSQAKKIKEEIKERDRLNFYRFNFLNKNLDLSHGTIFYSASTCFSENTMLKIWNKISNNENLNAIIALTSFPENCDFSKVKKTKTIKVPCSWSTSDAIIYYFK